ncbi:TetR/AcrR family transcriptional regulator [Edaphobacter bradus]|uniref:TetR/AcrR family transcriptional regulator n=1 Tax=Edaphobacter bradus TaxID=2259016 RepID=UPI0021DFF305|nr:TetR/AcrR family transcriptional regulator [Edaphobacter bradus]
MTTQHSRTKPNTREHLIDVGLQRIYATGYASTGVKEILDLAGVPKGSFYHYFRSKEAFAEEVLQRYVAEESRRTESIFSDTKFPPLTRLRSYFEEMKCLCGYTGPNNGCLLGNLSIEIAGQSDLLQTLLSRSFNSWQQSIADLLRSAIDRGDLAQTANPDELASFLLNSWEGALVRTKAEKSNQPLETFFHFAFDVLLKK